MTCANWALLHGDLTEDEGATYKDRYDNFFFASQYTIVHLSGDYPLTQYPVLVRVVHLASFFTGWAFVGLPSAVLMSGFRKAFEDKRKQARHKRAAASSKIQKFARGWIVRRRLREVVQAAVNQARFTDTT